MGTLEPREASGLADSQGVWVLLPRESCISQTCLPWVVKHVHDRSAVPHFCSSRMRGSPQIYKEIRKSDVGNLEHTQTEGQSWVTLLE